MKLVKLGLWAALCVPMIGACASKDAEQEDAEIGEQSAALGEGPCADYQPLTDAGTNPFGVSLFPAPESCGWSVTSADSPNNAYGVPGCPSQYIYEILHPHNRTMFFYPEWIDAPLSQGNCPAAHMEIGVYKEQAFVWSLHGTAKYHGVWSGSSCTFALDAGYSLIALNSPGVQYDAVRVAGVATRGSGAFALKQRVRLTVAHFVGC